MSRYFENREKRGSRLQRGSRLHTILVIRVHLKSNTCYNWRTGGREKQTNGEDVARLSKEKLGYSQYTVCLLSPRTTKLWRGYRVCPVRMYVSTYVRSFVCSPFVITLATSFIIQFQYNFTQILDMTIP